MAAGALGNVTEPGMVVVETHFSPVERAYTGRELRSHFAFDEFALVGDSAVAWIGPCRVDVPELVDKVDARAGAFIASPSMVHVLVEHFGVALVEAVLRQRLLARLAGDLLRESGAPEVRVGGNDLFAAGRKASVSVATVSAVSALIHFGINVRTEGTPIPTYGLAEAGIGTERFARDLLGRYAAEIVDIHRAAAKVRSVR
jgi:hypothetical protein